LKLETWYSFALSLTVPAEAAVALAVVSAVRRTREVRLPPSRAKRASASLAVAFGRGGKPDTTYCGYAKTAVAPEG